MTEIQIDRNDFVTISRAYHEQLKAVYEAARAYHDIYDTYTRRELRSRLDAVQGGRE